MEKFDAIITIIKGQIVMIEKVGVLRVKVSGVDREQIVALILALDVAERGKYNVLVRTTELNNIVDVVYNLLKQTEKALANMSVKDDHKTEITFHSELKEDQNE